MLQMLPRTMGENRKLLDFNENVLGISGVEKRCSKRPEVRADEKERIEGLQVQNYFYGKFYYAMYTKALSLIKAEIRADYLGVFSNDKFLPSRTFSVSAIFISSPVNSNFYLIDVYAVRQ